MGAWTGVLQFCFCLFSVLLAWKLEQALESESVHPDVLQTEGKAIPSQCHVGAACICQLGISDGGGLVQVGLGVITQVSVCNRASVFAGAG